MFVTQPRRTLDPSQELELFFATPRDFYFNEEITRLSDILERNGMRAWAVAPRLYLILYGVGHTHLTTEFIARGLNDGSFPLEETTLKSTPLATVPNGIYRFLQFQHRVTAHDSSVYESRLGDYFPPCRKLEKLPLHDTDFEQIGRLLRLCGQHEASASPKLYYVLRLIGNLDALPRFVSHHYDDIWFPYPRMSLSRVFSDNDTCKAFSQSQHYVCSLRWSEDTHMNFINDEHEYLESLKDLGSGGTGVVDHVYYPGIRKNYARKVIARNAEGLRIFANEVKLLKAVSHRHCISWSCSYTDTRVLAILAEPVADMNLGTFLDISPLPPDRKELLQTSFGCLSTALAYLHGKGIRHKDIKPQNILIHFNNILLTDFGLSADSIGESTSLATNTPRYCPPEVEDGLRRETSSDVWAMGCVFFEIVAALCDVTIDDLKKYFRKVGRRRMNFKDNPEAVTSWITEFEVLQKTLGGMARLALALVPEMLDFEPTDRPSSQTIIADLGKATNIQSLYNQCCRAELLATRRSRIGPNIISDPSEPTVEASELVEEPSRLDDLRSEVNEADTAAYSVVPGEQLLTPISTHATQNQIQPWENIGIRMNEADPVMRIGSSIESQKDYTSNNSPQASVNPSSSLDYNGTTLSAIDTTISQKKRNGSPKKVYRMDYWKQPDTRVEDRLPYKLSMAHPNHVRSLDTSYSNSNSSTGSTLSMPHQKMQDNVATPPQQIPQLLSAQRSKVQAILGPGVVQPTSFADVPAINSPGRDELPSTAVMPIAFAATALWDWDGERSDDLQLRRGQFVEIIGETTNPGWLYAYDRTDPILPRKHVPANYLNTISPNDRVVDLGDAVTSSDPSSRMIPMPLETKSNSNTNVTNEIVSRTSEQDDQPTYTIIGSTNSIQDFRDSLDRF